MKYLMALLLPLCLFSCKKNKLMPAEFKLDTLTVAGTFEGTGQVIVPPPCCAVTPIYGKSYQYSNVSLNDPIIFYFSAPVKKESVAANVAFNQTNGGQVNYNISYQKNGSIMIIQPSVSLSANTQYEIALSPGLLSVQDDSLKPRVLVMLTTK